jgi:hypothetical protein
VHSSSSITLQNTKTSVKTWGEVNMSFLLFGSIFQSNLVIVISAFCIVMFAVFFIYAVTNQNYNKSALRMLRDMLVGIVGGGIVAINLNATITSIIITLGFVGVMGLIYFVVDRQIY